MPELIKGFWKVYADGSGTHGSNSPACVGVVVCDPAGQIVVEGSAYIVSGSNNVAELWALRRALYLLRWASPLGVKTPAIIYSDSQYALSAARCEIAPKKNIDLVAELQQQAQRHYGFVVWRHVKGHDGDPGNELADWLAGRARWKCIYRDCIGCGGSGLKHFGCPHRPYRRRPVATDRLELLT